MLLTKSINHVCHDQCSYKCASLSQINIPDSARSIGSFAFSECFQITEMTKPSSSTEINIYAYRCLQWIKQTTIPSSITKIKGGAFASCYTNRMFCILRNSFFCHRNWT